MRAFREGSMLQGRRHWRMLLWGLMAVVSWLAFMPGAQPSQTIVHADKLAHVLAFAALGALAALGSAPGWVNTLRISLALLAYGLFIEAVQSFLPSRSAEWADLAADVLGIVIGQTLVAWYRSRRAAVQATGG